MYQHEQRSNVDSVMCTTDKTRHKRTEVPIDSVNRAAMLDFLFVGGGDLVAFRVRRDICVSELISRDSAAVWSRCVHLLCVYYCSGSS